MAKPIMSLESFEKALPSICDRQTSADPDGWTEGNPLWGHCAVASLLAQDMFGGELLRASLVSTPFAQMRSHYWNRLPDSREKDFSRAQFGDQYPTLTGEVRTRDYVLSNSETAMRYALLVGRMRLAQSFCQALGL